MPSGKRILLIVGGGIAAYKCLNLVRLLRDAGAGVSCVLTKAAEQFVTPLSVAALSESQVHQELFNPLEEAKMGHIELSRSADLLVVAPATADILAKMAGGLADDLASTILLATDKPVLAAPAMNVRMWLNPATQRNVAMLRSDGITMIGPETWSDGMRRDRNRQDGGTCFHLRSNQACVCYPATGGQTCHRDLRAHEGTDRPGSLHREQVFRKTRHCDCRCAPAARSEGNIHNRSDCGRTAGGSLRRPCRIGKRNAKSCARRASCGCGDICGGRS